MFPTLLARIDGLAGPPPLPKDAIRANPPSPLLDTVTWWFIAAGVVLLLILVAMIVAWFMVDRDRGWRDETYPPSAH